MARKQKRDKKTHENRSETKRHMKSAIKAFLLFQAPMTSQCSRTTQIWWIYQQNWSLGTALRSVSVLLCVSTCVTGSKDQACFVFDLCDRIKGSSLLCVRLVWQDQRIKPAVFDLCDRIKGSSLLCVWYVWQDQRIKPLYLHLNLIKPLYLHLNLQCFQFWLAVEWTRKTIAPSVICLCSWAATVQIRFSMTTVHSQTQ